MRNKYTVLVGKPAGQRPIERSRHRWEDNIKIDLRGRVWRCVLDSFASGQRPITGPYKHGNELSGSIKCWEFLNRLLKKHSVPWSHFRGSNW
jgi:hypothetical protein